MSVDIKTLMLSADWWERAGYVASAIVVIGIVIESIEIFKLIVAGKLLDKWLEFVGILVVVLGLAMEILTQVQSNNRTGLIIGALNDESAATLKEAADAQGDAAAADAKASSAMARAAALLEENVQLEHELAPREFNEAAVAGGVANLARVPIFIIPLNREEPRQIAGYLDGSLRDIKVGETEKWEVTTLPPEGWNPEGIMLQYKMEFGIGEENPSKKIAETVCEILKSEGLVASDLPLRISSIWS